MDIKSIKQKLKVSISYKLFVFGTISLVLLVLSIIWISNYISVQEYNKEVVRNNRSNMSVSSQYFSESMKNYDEILYSMLFDTSFIESLVEKDNESENFSSQNYIINKMFNINNINTDIIDGISVYTEWNNRLIEIPPYSSNVNFKYLEENNLRENELDFYSNGYILRRDVNDFHTGSYIATISMHVNWTSMSTAFSVFENNSNVLYIVNNNEIVYTNGDKYTNNLEEDFPNFKIEDNIIFDYFESPKKFIFSQRLLPDTYLLNIFEKDLTEGLNPSFIELSIYIIIITIILYFFVILFFNNTFIKPIKQLSKQMSLVKFDKLSEIKFTQYSSKTDEISTLNNNYHSMMNQLKYMIDRQYKYEIYTKQIQFQALQNKINPHFLRNTLQVIGNHALNNKGETTYNLIGSLSNMFNYILYNKETSTLYEEYENIKEYLAIQQARFPDKLQVDLYLDPEVKDFKIPILTLQPLIENSFQHGFISKNEIWKLKVSIEKVFNEVIVTISDNGIGISKEKHENLKSILSDKKAIFYNNERIGIKNVDDRLKIIYGDESGLDIHSSEGKWFKVIFSIKIN